MDPSGWIESVERALNHREFLALKNCRWIFPRKSMHSLMKERAGGSISSDKICNPQSIGSRIP
jgi:hypothetical protein